MLDALRHGTSRTDRTGGACIFGGEVSIEGMIAVPCHVMPCLEDRGGLWLDARGRTVKREYSVLPKDSPEWLVSREPPRRDRLGRFRG